LFNVFAPFFAFSGDFHFSFAIAHPFANVGFDFIFDWLDAL
jgi:hypothetical protein